MYYCHVGINLCPGLFSTLSPDLQVVGGLLVGDDLGHLPVA